MSLVKGLVQGAAQGFVDSAIGKFLGHGATQEKSGFSAQNIVSSLSKSGVAHSGHFEVQLVGPKGNINSNDATTTLSADSEREMMYRAESVELPGRSLATLDHRFDNYSPITRVVTGQTYVDVAITFLLSEDLREKEYFEKWQNAAVQTGAFFDAGQIAKNNPSYYNDYIGTVIIRQYGADGTLRSVHKLDKAYPLVLGGVQMSWSDEAFARMVVSFSYQTYRVIFYNQDQAKKGISGGFSIGKGGIAGSLSVPGIGTINAGGGRIATDLGAGATALGKKIFNAL